MDNEQNDIMNEDLKPKKKRGKGIIDPTDPPTPHERKPKSVKKYEDDEKITKRQQTYHEYYERNRERLLQRRREAMDKMAREDPEKYRKILDRAKNRYHRIKKKKTKKDKQLYEDFLKSQEEFQKRKKKAETDGVELQVHKYIKRTPYKEKPEVVSLKVLKETNPEEYKKKQDIWKKSYQNNKDKYQKYYQDHQEDIKKKNLARYYSKKAEAAAKAAQANESNTNE